MAFVVGDVNFEDNRLEQGAWVDLKPSTPFAALPVLHLDSGEQLAQADAILRYAGKLSGLYPKDDDLAAMRVDMWLGAEEDVMGEIRPTVYEKNEEKKMAMRKVLREETLPKWLGIFDKQIDTNGTGFLVGSSMTVADLKLFGIMETLKSGMLDGVPTTIADAYPKLKELYEMVAKHEKIAAYREKAYPPK